MDAFHYIAKRRIEEAMKDGLFDHLPKLGEIDCRLKGEAFFREWLARKLEREGYIPPETERMLVIVRLEREIPAMAARVRNGEEGRAAFDGKVAERNRLVRAYNLTMPPERHLFVRPPEFWLERA